MKCHICESETDFTCDRCGEPVCFDCCVPMTVHNQIDYPLCTTCEDVRNAQARLKWLREHEREETQRKLKDERNRKARARYRSPESIAKRAARKAELKQLRQAQLEEAMRVVANVFGFR